MGIIDNSVIKINIDGIEFSAKKGSKIIEIADEVGIYIPRFCYHKKLSIAANCRMCLVEVEKAPKLLPACATPIIDGMKIFTNTEKVIDAQRAVMEFLLINHPLDCPICDQGGECELQDLAIGYGCSSSRFIEGKRSFEDYDLGPLVATDVTRCILCSRCVRFCTEIAGTEDLGIINRGSNSRIFTFLKDFLKSEISGNVIDLCPVGALTAKPSRFKFRPWELVQNAFISPHDCIGSNIYIHVFKNKIVRIVPKKNDYINESWISDRDRFSYEGIYSADRITTPLIKKNDKWEITTWDDALSYTANKLNAIKNQNTDDNIGCIVSPNSTLEELFLLQKLTRSLGSKNIDHRIKQIDFSKQENFPIYPGLDINIDEIDNMDTVLIIGGDIVKEQPIIGLKLRKIINKNGNVFAINPIDFNFSMKLKKIITNPKNFINILLSILKICINKNKNLINKKYDSYLSNITPQEEIYDLTEKLYNSKNTLILLGSYAISHPDFSKILAISLEIKHLLNTNFGILTDGANSSGAWLTGCIPHRLENNKNINAGLDAFRMFDKKLKAYILFNTEIEYDCSYPDHALKALNSAEFTLSFSSFKTKSLLKFADVILPIATIYENSGTFINVSGILQSFNAVVTHSYKIKQGWKAVNDLAKYFKYSGFNYICVEDILKNIKTTCAVVDKIQWNKIDIDNITSKIPDGLINILHIDNYTDNAIVRRATALQKTYNKNTNIIRMNIKTHNNLKITNNSVTINKSKNEYSILLDNNLSDNLISINNNDIINNNNIFNPYEQIILEKI